MNHLYLFFPFRVINEKGEEIELFSSVECKVGYWVLHKSVIVGTHVNSILSNLDFTVWATL